MRPTDVLRNKQGLHLDRTAVQLGGKSVSVSAIQNFHRRPPPRRCYRGRHCSQLTSPTNHSHTRPELEEP